MGRMLPQSVQNTSDPMEAIAIGWETRTSWERRIARAWEKTVWFVCIGVVFRVAIAFLKQNLENESVLPGAPSRNVNFFSAGSKIFGRHACSLFPPFTSASWTPHLRSFPSNAGKQIWVGACLILSGLGTSGYAQTTLPQLHSDDPLLAGSCLSTPMSRSGSLARSFARTPQLVGPVCSVHTNFVRCFLLSSLPQSTNQPDCTIASRKHANRVLCLLFNLFPIYLHFCIRRLALFWEDLPACSCPLRQFVAPSPSAQTRHPSLLPIRGQQPPSINFACDPGIDNATTNERRASVAPSHFGRQRLPPQQAAESRSCHARRVAQSLLPWPTLASCSASTTSLNRMGSRTAAGASTPACCCSIPTRLHLNSPRPNRLLSPSPPPRRHRPPQSRLQPSINHPYPRPPRRRRHPARKSS